MHVLLWVLQGVLAGVFLMAGAMKLLQGKAPLEDEKMAAHMGWMNDFSEGQVRAIGAVEVTGALGLVLPAVAGIAPILTPIAATGLAVDMTVAAFVHARRSEMRNIAMNSVLFAMAVLIAWGRFGPESWT